MDFIKNFLPPMPVIKFPKMKKLRQWSSQSLDRMATDGSTAICDSGRRNSQKMPTLNKIQYISTISSVHMVSTMDREGDRGPIGLAALKRDRAYERQMAKRSGILLNVPMHHHFFSASEMVHEKFSPCKKRSDATVAPESLPPYEHREFIQIDFNRVTHIDQQQLKSLEQSLEKAKNRNLEIVKTWPAEESRGCSQPQIKPPPRRRKKLRPPPPPPVSQIETPRHDFQLGPIATPVKCPRRRRNSQTSCDSLSLQPPVAPSKNLTDLHRYQFMQSIVSTPDSMTSLENLPLEKPKKKVFKIRHSKSEDSLDSMDYPVKKGKSVAPAPPQKWEKSESLGNVLDEQVQRKGSFEKYMRNFLPVYVEPVKVDCTPVAINQIPNVKFPDPKPVPETEKGEELKIKRQTGWRKDSLFSSLSLESIAESPTPQSRQSSIDIFKKNQDQDNQFDEFDTIFSSPAHVIRTLPVPDFEDLDCEEALFDTCKKTRRKSSVEVTEDLELVKTEEEVKDSDDEDKPIEQQVRRSSVTVQDFGRSKMVPRCKSFSSSPIHQATVNALDQMEVPVEFVPQIKSSLFCRSLETIHNSSIVPETAVPAQKPALQQAQSVTTSATTVLPAGKRPVYHTDGARKKPAPSALEPTVTVLPPPPPPPANLKSAPRPPSTPKFDNPIDCRSNLNNEIKQFYENRQKLLKKVVVKGQVPAAPVTPPPPPPPVISRIKKQRSLDPTPSILITDNSDPDEFRRNLLADINSRRAATMCNNKNFLSVDSNNYQNPNSKYKKMVDTGSQQRRLNMASVEVEFSV